MPVRVVDFIEVPQEALDGVMSGLLTTAFPGGTTALNSSAIRSTLSTGATSTALRGSIADAIKTYAASTARGAQSLARGALDEIPQELLDEGISQLSSAYAEGRDPKQAVTDFIIGLPQLIATSGVMGAGGEHLGNSRQTQVQAQAQAHGQTQAPTIPSNTTVAADTALPGNSGQQAPASAASTPLPVPTPAETSAAYKAIEKLKAQKAALSPDQQQQLDAAEKTFARKTEDNILKQQAAIEKRGGTLHPTTAKALSDAQAKLGRAVPATATPSSSDGVPSPTGTSSGDPAPPSAASSSSQPPIPHNTTQSNTGSGQPAQSPSAPASPPLPVPTRAEASAAHQTIDKLKAQESPLSSKPPSRNAAANSTRKPPRRWPTRRPGSHGQTTGSRQTVQ